MTNNPQTTNFWNTPMNKDTALYTAKVYLDGVKAFVEERT